MEQQNPDETVEVLRWRWDLFLKYIGTVERLFLAVEDLNDRAVLQPELRSIYLQVSADMEELDESGPELESPSENHESGAVATQNGPELLEVREAAYRARAAYARRKRWWCIYLSTGQRVNYYGTKAGAVAKCEALAAPANISCVAVRAGRCP